jgi:hypothetical protein
LNPRGAHNDTRERARLLARGSTPPDPHATSGPRRIRDQARDGLSAAAISLGGSICLTGVLWIVLRWVG